MEIHLFIKGDSDDADFKALLAHVASGCKGPKITTDGSTLRPVKQATGDDSASEPTKDPDPAPAPAPPAPPAPPAEPKVDYTAVRKEALGTLQSIAKVVVDGQKCIPVAAALVKDYAKDPEDAARPKLSEVPDESLSDLLAAAKAKLEELQAQAALS